MFRLLISIAALCGLASVSEACPTVSLQTNAVAAVQCGSAAQETVIAPAAALPTAGYVPQQAFLAPTPVGYATAVPVLPSLGFRAGFVGRRFLSPFAVGINPFFGFGAVNPFFLGGRTAFVGGFRAGFVGRRAVFIGRRR